MTVLTMSKKAKPAFYINELRMAKNRLIGVFGTRKQANEVIADIIGGPIGWKTLTAEQAFRHLWALRVRGLA